MSHPLLNPFYIVPFDIEERDETDPAKRNWVQIRFYYNEGWHNPNDRYSGDLCSIINSAYSLHKNLTNYEYPQDYYDSKREKYIEGYYDFPLTKEDYSGIPEEERIEKRNEIIRSMWEKKKEGS